MHHLGTRSHDTGLVRLPYNCRSGWNVDYNQESTRYVDFSNGFKMVFPDKLKNSFEAHDAHSTLQDIYVSLRKNKVSKEDARFFLPNGIHSQIAVTIRHETLFGRYKLTRADGKTGKPSSEIQELAKEMIRLVENEVK